ncbi:MAG: EamA family transporter [bacterium]
MTTSPSRLKLILAFGAVYIFWGSTYLAIRIAIETVPPFLMAGIRFLTAGAILFGWTMARGESKPTIAHWKSAALLGFILLLIGNGALTWSEQFLPSSIAALIVTATPLWFVIVDCIQHGVRPTIQTIVGLLLGSIGMVILIDPTRIGGGAQIDIRAAIVLLIASLAWAGGSLYTKTIPTPSSPLVSTGMQMIAGGVFLLLLGLVSGELQQVQLSKISGESLLAMLYLMVFGSLIGFTSYSWLLKVASPAMVSTYAYVNPLVAVFLGWLIADELITTRILFAAVIIIVAVVTITVENIRKTSKVIKNMKVAHDHHNLEASPENH